MLVPTKIPTNVPAAYGRLQTAETNKSHKFNALSDDRERQRMKENIAVVPRGGNVTGR
jgi:hypothetical protein